MLIGYEQTFELYGLSPLVLEGHNFKAEESNGDLAYTRAKQESTIQQVDYTLYGRAYTGYRPFVPKYSFAWSLWLEEAKTELLIALIAEQDRRLAMGLNARILLTDNRLGLCETVRTRPSAGSVPGFANAYWPVFSIKLESSEPVLWAQYDGTTYYTIEAKGVELDNA